MKDMNHDNRWGEVGRYHQCEVLQSPRIPLSVQTTLLAIQLHILKQYFKKDIKRNMKWRRRGRGREGKREGYSFELILVVELHGFAICCP